jgi:hypothetical protein
MPPAAATIPTAVMQGIEVPASSVDPRAFFQLTRRLRVLAKTAAYAGLGLEDNVPMLAVGVISSITVRFSGTLTLATPTGTVATTARWPYDLLKSCRFSANGQSNLINASGSKLKARDLMARGDLSDRGVIAAIGGASPGTSRQQGTLKLESEAWGVGSNVTGLSAGAYPVELTWEVPVAFDQLSLLGAIFAQTSSTDLNLALGWALATDLFVLTGTATAVLTGTFSVEVTTYSIPQGPNGDIIVPDLSAFHSLIQNRYAAVSNGEYEMRLAGQGVGRQLLRVFWHTWNGAGAGTPLPVTAANFGRVGWRYGGNDNPENWLDGTDVRQQNERVFNCDLGGLFGFKVIDFASENAFRDAIDEGTATELRIFETVQAAVALATPVTEYVQETVFAGAVGA